MLPPAKNNCTMKIYSFPHFPPSNTQNQVSAAHIHFLILLALSYTAAQVRDYILNLFYLNKFYQENTLPYHSLALSLFLNIGLLLLHCSMEILFSHTLSQDDSSHIHSPILLTLSYTAAQV